MLLLGLDIGTSSVKASLVDAATQQLISESQYPNKEREITAKQTGWAEQNPETWWQDCLMAIQGLSIPVPYHKKDIVAIGIAYQMHGLVVVDKQQNVLRPSIIWCDSRASEIGNQAFEAIGKQYCLENLLNSPGNFTASKLSWVKKNEQDIYEKIDKMMLPGDYIAMKLTGQISSTSAGLSEGIFWDFNTNTISQKILNHFGFDESIIPATKPVFSSHGTIKKDIAQLLGLSENVEVCYKAGDQPNNALSLNVFEPGEIAATAGTSGVIYAVSEKIRYDSQSRVNSFAHVNHSPTNPRIGVLLCINGTGILNSFVKNKMTSGLEYAEMNRLAQKTSIGADGLSILPFGNGAERVFNNQQIGSQILNLDFNKHTQGHIFRGVQEGIACSFNYGFEIMKEMGVVPTVIRAGKANLFLSDLFVEALVSITQQPVELYKTDGAKGAALAAGIGKNIYKNRNEAFEKIEKIKTVEPEYHKVEKYKTVFGNWENQLGKFIKN